MGFFAGFFGGFTLTASVLYLSVQVHRSTRIAQKNAIREQVEAINDIASPLGAYYRKFAEDVPKESHILPSSKKPSAEELLKQQWNKEVESLARKTVSLRWQDVTNNATEVATTITKLVKRE